MSALRGFTTFDPAPPAAVPAIPAQSNRNLLMRPRADQIIAAPDYATIHVSGR